MIKGIIFDLDGTLLDSMPAWEHLGEEYLREIGVEPEENLNEILADMSTRQGAEYVVRHYRLSLTVDQVIDGINDRIHDFYFYQAPMKPGIMEFIQYFQEKEIPMTIATASAREIVEAALKRLQIDGFFQKVLTCPDMKTNKTEPDIYIAAAENMQTVLAETWVFEDSLFALETAKHAGFPTVGVYDLSSASQWKKIQETADYSMENIADAEKFFKTASRS